MKRADEGAKCCGVRVQNQKAEPVVTDQVIFFPGSLPGMNEILKASSRQGASGWGGYATIKEAVGQSLWVQITNAKLRPVQIGFFEFEWVEQDRRRDKDNISCGRKFILDAFVKARVIPGDGWRYVAGFMDRFSVDSAAPGVRVTIREVE